MDFTTFKARHCKHCLKPVKSIIGLKCEHCEAEPKCSHLLDTFEKTVTIEKLDFVSWKDGPDIQWLKCEGVKFGLMTKKNNQLAMCNHQGIEVVSSDFSPMGLSMLIASFDFLDK